MTKTQAFYLLLFSNLWWIGLYFYTLRLCSKRIARVHSDLYHILRTHPDTWKTHTKTCHPDNLEK